MSFVAGVGDSLPDLAGTLPLIFAALVSKSLQGDGSYDSVADSWSFEGLAMS